MKQSIPWVRVVGAKKNDSTKVIVLTGEAIDRTDGVDHNYTEAADSHIVVLASSKAQYRSLKHWVKERIDLDPIPPGTLGARSKFEELNDTLTLVYPSSALETITKKFPSVCMDANDINLPDNAELLRKRTKANPEYFFKGK